MFPFRNGSLPANALLIAVGAAAGVGVTVLVAPLRIWGKPADEELAAHRQTAGTRKVGTTPRPENSPSAPVTTEPGNPQERAAAIREAGAEAARRDPAHALLLAGNFTSEQDKLEFLRGIYSVWAAADPVAALDYAKTSLPAGLARSEAIGIAVNKWASQDPRAAWLWSEANLSGPLKEQAFTDVLIGWTRKTPAAAAQWLASSGYNSQPLIHAVATTWAEQNPQAAANWAKSLPNPEAQHTALVSVAAEWAIQNPLAAAENFTLAVSQLDGAALATTITDIWGTTNPVAASAWINKLPPGPGKDEAAATLAIEQNRPIVAR